MRALSFLICCLTMSTISAPTQGATSGNTKDATITLLHTNDIHGHVSEWRGWEGDLDGKQVGGFDRLAAVVKEVRARTGEANVLLLDSGDAIGDSMLADLTKGRAGLECMAALRYDAMALGNHEPDFNAETLRSYIAEGKVRMLAANVRANGQLIAQPFLIKEIGGVKVGVLGLAYPNTPLTTAQKNVESLAWDRDSAEVARRFIPQMRKQGAQLIILLTHLGLGADKKLAQAVPGIDVILGGHSHNRMQRATQVGPTLIVQAGAHLSDLGLLELRVHDGKISSYERRLIPLTGASDPEMAGRIAQLRQPFAAQLNESLGEATAPIIRAQTLAGDEARKRDQQSPADSLFADILRGQTKSDVALLPGVGYGVAIPAGKITAEMLRNLVPHESKVVTMHLTGAQLRQILAQSVTNTYTDDPQLKVGGIIQVSGLRFTHNEREVLDNSLDPDRNYRVATNSMLANGGHNYATFREGKERAEQGSQFEMIAEWIKQHQEVSAPTDVRISTSTQ